MAEDQFMPNDEIWNTGANLLKQFGASLFNMLEDELKGQWGADWFDACTQESLSKHRPIKKDLQGLLREIVDSNNRVFRLALARSLFSTSALHKSVLDDLAQIKKLRNEWFHEESELLKQITPKDLTRLVDTLLRVTKDLSMIAYCQQIKKSLSEKNLINLVRATPFIARHENEIVTNSEKYRDLEMRLAQEIATYSGVEREREIAYKSLAHAWRIENYRYRSMLLLYRGKMMGMLWKFIMDDETPEDDNENWDWNDDKASWPEPFGRIRKLQRNYEAALYPYMETSELQLLSEEIRKTMGKENCTCTFCIDQPLNEILGFLTREDYGVTEFVEEILTPSPPAKFIWVAKQSN